jgi:predicted phosphodiesterase
VVDPAQIGGVNAYNLEIARKRARTLIEHTIDLLTNHMVNPQYPGIVFALGGDMFSGDIHEELMATNEKEVMPTFIDIYEVLVWCIETLADQYKRVFVPCVTGNHGRNTHKIRSKGRNFTNFDWLLYQLLARHFEKDTRVRFSIPDGPDCLYKIYGHRYLLTHGDQFRGSDALSALVRGDHKKRNRNNQINMEYDTMICGHFHTLIQLQRLIVNGCFPAGSLVTLANGTRKAIEEVQIGERVLTHRNQARTVIDTYSRDNVTSVIHFRAGTKASEVRLTPNHRVWAIKGNTVPQQVPNNGRWLKTQLMATPDWVEARYLSAGDYVQVPYDKSVVDSEDIDAGLCKLLGYYLAEGSSSGKNGKLHDLEGYWLP